MTATVYQFGVDSSERRAFIDNEEIGDLALRARATASTLESFAALDDQGRSILRSELLRQLRELSDRAIAVLS